MQTVDELKVDRLFFEAGVEAFKQGAPRSYGCHFGMRSSRDYAINEFYRGYDAAPYILANE